MAGKTVPRKKTSAGEQPVWKCESMAAAKRKDRVFVRGFDKAGGVVFDKTFGGKKWFEDLHPVVTTNAFRRERRIVRILVKRYDKYGALLHDTLQDYSPQTGEYVHGQCLHRNNTIVTY